MNIDSHAAAWNTTLVEKTFLPLHLMWARASSIVMVGWDDQQLPCRHLADPRLICWKEISTSAAGSAPHQRNGTWRRVVSAFQRPATWGAAAALAPVLGLALFLVLRTPHRRENFWALIGLFVGLNLMLLLSGAAKAELTSATGAPIRFVLEGIVVTLGLCTFQLLGRVAPATSMLGNAGRHVLMVWLFLGAVAIPSGFASVALLTCYGVPLGSEEARSLLASAFAGMNAIVGLLKYRLDSREKEKRIAIVHPADIGPMK